MQDADMGALKVQGQPGLYRETMPQKKKKGTNTKRSVIDIISKILLKRQKMRTLEANNGARKNMELTSVCT
jgi:hypothetical protein